MDSSAKATEKPPLILRERESEGLALLQTFSTHHMTITGGNVHPEIEAGNRERYLAIGNDKMVKAHEKHYGELLEKVRYLRPPACKDWAEFVIRKDKAEKPKNNSKSLSCRCEPGDGRGENLRCQIGTSSFLND